MIVRKGTEFLGIIVLMDSQKNEEKSVITRLKNSGIKRLIMLTGDTHGSLKVWRLILELLMQHP